MKELKRVYEYTSYGRRYYKAVVHYEGTKVQRSFTRAVEAHKWVQAMLDKVSVTKNCTRSPVRWWKQPFYCRQGIPMIQVPAMRCSRYWDCAHQLSCLDEACRLDFPGWAEPELAASYYDLMERIERRRNGRPIGTEEGLPDGFGTAL